MWRPPSRSSTNTRRRENIYERACSSFHFPGPFGSGILSGYPEKALLGALLPGGILLLLAGLSIAIRDPSGMLPGIPCAAGLAAAWLIGRNKATAAEKAELEKMRAKDL